MPKFEYIFRPVKGRFVCVSYSYPFTIDEILSFLSLEIDDDCQFCRITREGTTYEFRHYNNFKITLTVYEQNP